MGERPRPEAAYTKIGEFKEGGHFFNYSSDLQTPARIWFHKRHNSIIRLVVGDSLVHSPFGSDAKSLRDEKQALKLSDKFDKCPPSGLPEKHANSIAVIQASVFTKPSVGMRLWHPEGIMQ